jgi:hypothetical protein
MKIPLAQSFQPQVRAGAGVAPGCTLGRAVKLAGFQLCPGVSPRAAPGQAGEVTGAAPDRTPGRAVKLTGFQLCPRVSPRAALGQAGAAAGASLDRTTGRAVKLVGFCSDSGALSRATPGHSGMTFFCCNGQISEGLYKLPLLLQETPCTKKKLIFLTFSLLHC